MMTRLILPIDKAILSNDTTNFFWWHNLFYVLTRPILSDDTTNFVYWHDLLKNRAISTSWEDSTEDADSEMDEGIEP